MSDKLVAELLRSDEPLALIDAAAGCGKTFQGAEYARDAALAVGNGRILILTHTHAACSVFQARTSSSRDKVEIRTIDALVAQIAGVYHKALGLPVDVTSWAWRDGGRNFDELARRVATFLTHQPMIGAALAARYPVVICDEHQDSSPERHDIVMALHRGGSKLRIFGDTMQSIYGSPSDRQALKDRERWEALRASGASGKLEHPHRWRKGCSDLGAFIMAARKQLESGGQVDLSGPLPPSVKVLVADNISPNPKGYQLDKDQRKPIDALVRTSSQIMVLASQNDLVAALRAFWYRQLPIWEGHTRDALVELVATERDNAGNPEALAQAMLKFVGATSKGFSPSSHGAHLIREVREGCAKRRSGKPANIQTLARAIVEDPTHKGVSASLAQLRDFVSANVAGFKETQIDRRTEFGDGIRLGEHATPDEGFAELARRRAHVRPQPPQKVLSSIHKAKGLECENVIIAGCGKKQFTETIYSRAKLYVALSRPMNSLTILVPSNEPSPLFKIK